MANYRQYECEGCGYTVAANPKGKECSRGDRFEVNPKVWTD